MKKLYVLPVLLCLCSCDNTTIVGKCLPNERTVTTITEQNGETIKTSTTELFLCGCFDNVESDTPQFMISKEEFLFKISNAETINEIETITENTINKTCNKKCTKLCK